MHIKEIVIHGFKSYREQTTSEPFHEGHNVIVGRNGSGKSNFFAAIRFVLADAYTSLSAQERSALLHDGTGASTVSAYVELVIDNSDGRFPTGRDTLVLRRTVGLKKDEYSIDRKSVGKADVMNLLEAAGFSRANPFYIVPQGRITHLTNAKDIERLNLLKDVAGTKVYETRRAESMGIMQETETKQAKIDELLEYIKERLTSLEEEMEELRKYQTLDKEKRCLDYCVQEHQLEEVAKVLAEVEEEYERELESHAKLRGERDETASSLAEIEASLGTLRSEIQALQTQASQLEDERREVAAEYGRKTAEMADIQADEARQDEARQTLSQELQSLQTTLAGKEEAYFALLPQLKEAQLQEEDGVRSYQTAQVNLQSLLQKAGRAEQFKSKSQRDAFLKAEIQRLTDHIASNEGQLKDAKAEVQALIDEESNVVEETSEVITCISDRQQYQARVGEELSQLRQELTRELEHKKSLWRQEAQYESSTTQANDALRKARLSLAGTLERQTAQGIESIERIQQRLNLPGYHGPLYTLFSVDHRYKTCAEVVAGNSIFDIVVDNDDTAATLLNAMKAEKGRVTFVPLNRIKTNDAQLPQGADAIPLVKRVTHDPVHAKVIEQVFGRAYVCPNIQIAGVYAAKYGVTAITLDGDKVDRKGTMSGGYFDKRKSRLDAVVAINDWTAKLTQASEALRHVRSDIVVSEQKATDLAGRIRKSEIQLFKFGRISGDEFSGRYDSLIARRRELQRSIQDASETIAHLETQRLREQFEVKSLQDELRTPMRELTQVERDELHQLQKEVETLSGEKDKLVQIRADLQSQAALLDIEINDNLQKRIANTKSKIASSQDNSTGVESRTSGEHNQMASRAKTSLDSLTRELEQVEKTVDQKTSKQNALQSQLEDMKSKAQESLRSFEAQQLASEKYLARKQHLLRRQEECQSAIRDLGVLPEEAYEKYDPTAFNASKVFKRLKKLSEQVRKYSHVNKKAFDQHHSFTRQREQLIERREELSGSSTSIISLIENLDRQKDEAIARTFSQVAQNFADVFERLVPLGRGRLIIQRRMDENNEPAELPQDDSQLTQGAGDNYTGVAIKVSFNSKHDEGLRIQQLSGGQKSLCALALIFAIQRCDPAPFYLFDEIDANLDAQYRTAVADMIHELSASAQFIVTTFRPELLQKADKYYGVLFRDKVSSLHCIDAERALEFVEMEQTS